MLHVVVATQLAVRTFRDLKSLLSYYNEVWAGPAPTGEIMCKKKLFLLIVCCATAGGSQAQKMYKTVGPDGKITFSDRPEIGADTKVSVMRSNTLHPVEIPANRIDPALAMKPAPRRKGAATQEPAPVITPEVEEAMLSVMGLSEFGRRFDGFCNATDAGAKAFAAANYGWKKRNAAAMEQQKRLLTEVLSPVQRAQLIDREQQVMAEEIGKAAALTPAARKTWCEGVIAELDSGRNDVDKPAMMALPIVQYRAK